MWPPVGSPLKSKFMSIYFPNRLELSFRFVLALPNASMIWLDLINTVVTLDTEEKQQNNGSIYMYKGYALSMESLKQERPLSSIL